MAADTFAQSNRAFPMVGVQESKLLDRAPLLGGRPTDNDNNYNDAETASQTSAASAATSAATSNATSLDTVAADEASMPKSFYCSLTHDVLKDPVILADGQTYEREAIQEWLQRSKDSPLTGETLPFAPNQPSHPTQHIHAHSTRTRTRALAPAPAPARAHAFTYTRTHARRRRTVGPHQPHPEHKSEAND